MAASTLLASLNALRRRRRPRCWHSLARGKLSNEIVLMIAITVMTAKNYCPEKGERRREREDFRALRLCLRI